MRDTKLESQGQRLTNHPLGGHVFGLKEPEPGPQVLALSARPQPGKVQKLTHGIFLDHNFREEDIVGGWQSVS